MSNPAIRQLAGCRGKVRFATFTMAKRTAHRQSKRRERRFMPYACQFCGGFHVGTRIGDDDHPGGAPDGRQRWMVFAADPQGQEVLFGWSNASDGGRVAQLVTQEAGWRLTRIIERKRRAA